MKKKMFLVLIIFLFFIKIVEAQPEHPHLFFNNDTIPLIRAKASDDSINNLGYSSKEAWDRIVIQPANTLLKGPNYWNAPSTSISWTDISRWKERDLVTLSMAYVITGNATYKEKLKNLTLSLARWENWSNPCREHSCLDTCHLTMGASLAYDVIYDILNESERNETRNAIIEKGILPLYNDSAGIPVYHNFFALYIAGIGVSTIVILDEDPRTDEWLNYSINSTIKFFDSQGTYGGTYEGQLYGAYSMDHLVSFMEALLINNKTNLYEHPFVQNVYKYAIYFVSPDGETSSNFGDTRDDGLTWSTALSSIASRTNNPYAQWYVAERKRLQNPKWYFYGIVGNLWFNNSIIAINPEAYFPSSYNFQDVGDVAFRTGWDDDDWFLAFKSGVFVGHGHLDHNSFIINLEGTWYLTDPGYRESYNPARTNFTYGTVGHNTILVDGNFQRAWRNGSIEKFYTSNYFDYVLGEAADVYDDLNQFSRHILFVKPRYFLIFDDIKSDSPHQYSWLYHTDQQGKAINEIDDYFIEKEKYRILIKQVSSSNLTHSILTYPGAEYFGPYLETKNQNNQNNIKSLTLLYPKEADSDLFNLLTNPDFTYSDTDWNKNQSASGDISTDSTHRRSPYFSEKISCSSINETNYVYQRLPVNSSLNYTGLAWIKTESVNGGAFIHLWYWNSSNNYLKDEKSFELNGTNDWTLITLNSTAPIQASEVTFALELQGNGTVWFDDTLFRETIISELKPIYYNGSLTGSIINYNNTIDAVIINSGNGFSNYSTSIGNIISDANIIILSNPEKIDSFAIQNGTSIVYNNSLIYQSETKSEANFIDNVTHYKGFVETTSETIKLYIEKPISNVFINETKINENQFSYDSETKILTLNLTI